MDDPEPLLDAVRRGDRQAVDDLLVAHRDYLRAVVALRMDPRLRARVDESDVVQEASLAAARRMADYLDRRPMGFRLWLRQTALECLLQLRRRHLGADCRAAGREVALSDPSALLLAGRLLPVDTPSGAARERERVELVRRAVADLPDDDREVILLRVYEGLANAEAAAVLGLHPDAASKRFARALIRLRRGFATLGLTGSAP
jgi:RNA polymerase sigma-70 factor (ECF subfamily)